MGRRVDASVAQDQPDLLERNAMAQHLGRRRVSQDVRPLDWHHDAGPLHEAFHHRRDAVTFPERSKRRDIPQEHVITWADRGAACDGEVVARRRDRAIVLLLARLGLRAGDVAQLRLNDIEWETSSLRVSGKSRYEVRLPLPQDVGDAIAAYLARRPSTCPSDHVFLRNIAPFQPFRKGDGISSVVKRLMQRAGVVAPVKGAHVLRHTAATEMLRHGVPLEKIGLVLRHRGIDTTAYYAKADVKLLKQIAQPWPEAL